MKHTVDKVTKWFNIICCKWCLTHKHSSWFQTQMCVLRMLLATVNTKCPCEGIFYRVGPSCSLWISCWGLGCNIHTMTYASDWNLYASVTSCMITACCVSLIHSTRWSFTKQSKITIKTMSVRYTARRSIAKGFDGVLASMRSNIVQTHICLLKVKSHWVQEDVLPDSKKDLMANSDRWLLIQNTCLYR